MKKIFTLISMAFLAMSANAQATLDVSSSAVKPIIEAAIANPVVLNNTLFIAVPQEEKIFPAGTYATNNYEIVTGGSAIGLKNYSWEASTENVTVKANSTLNADSQDDSESWRFNIGINDDGSFKNTSLTAPGCSPVLATYVNAKTGNPSPAYKDFYEYPSQKTTDEAGNEIDLIDENGNYVSDLEGDPIHRILEPVWEPGKGDLPAKGNYYEFTSKKNGVLKIAIFLNKNLNSNKLYIIDESTKDEGYKALTNEALTIKGFRQNYNYEVEKGSETNLATFTLTEDFLLTHDLMGTDTNRPFYGYVSFNVKAGVTYMALTPKNQLGLFGFSFEAASSDGINNVKTTQNSNAAMYNLAGQKVSDSFKGIVIQNGRKMIQK